MCRTGSMKSSASRTVWLCCATAKLVGAKAVKDTTPSELVNMIVGREVKDLYVRAKLNRGRETLRVSNLAADGAGPVSFTAYEGEVLGLVGLRGAGHEQVARALFGAEAFHWRRAACMASRST